MGKKQFCFFQTAETGNRTPDSGVKGSGANHYPRAPAHFPASNDEKYINVVYIRRKCVSFYGYVHWRMTTEISVMYGSEKVKLS